MFKYTSKRSIKTLHTRIYNGNQLSTRQNFLTHISLLDKILNSTNSNKFILYAGKYKRLPQFINSSDNVRIGNFVRDMINSLQMDQASDLRKQMNPSEKLGKIGLELFIDCHKNNITPLSTALTCSLMNHYHKYPCKEYLDNMVYYLREVQKVLKKNKKMLNDRNSIDNLINNLCPIHKDAQTVKEVLNLIDYQLYSDDVVRITRGKKMFDEIDLSKGWKYPCGISNTNNAYLRSLDIPSKKLVSINEKSLVMIYDGNLNESDKILPTLHYATKIKKSVLCIITGDISGDALTSIIINNNKNNRNSNPSRAIILKYNSKEHNDIILQENLDFINFLKMPLGVGSIYSPDFSEYVPSSASANQFYGSIESIKATLDESFLYNSQSSSIDPNTNTSLQNTVTISIGGETELEIDQRRMFLDNIMNNMLCHGFSEGFVPSMGVSLVKTIPYLDQQPVDSQMMKASKNAVIESLTIHMANSIKHTYAFDKYHQAKLISETINNSDFNQAYFDKSCNMIQNGFLEPWNKIDQCIDNVIGFLKLITSCDVVISKYFENPKKRGDR